MSLKTEFLSLATDVQNTYDTLSRFNNFLGLNIANSPSYIIKDAFQSGSYLLVVGALMIPILAALTQFLNVKLMPQPTNNGSTGNEQADAMAAGMVIYWVAGAVIRSIQQVVINRHIDKIDFDEVIRKNMEKEEENRRKSKDTVAKSTVNQSARMNTKYLNSTSGLSQKEKDVIIEKAKAAPKKEGSIAAKANMVHDYMEQNNK